MSKLFDFGCDCSDAPEKEITAPGIMIAPSMEAFSADIRGAGGCEGYERPGYRMCPFVRGFVETAVGPVPRVDTAMDKRDMLSTLLVRTGIHRHDYKVAPGVYCVGDADKDSEVLVTANYKLTFDHLRRELESVNAWILVLDTKGVNVWCAAGKKTFSTDEIVRRVKAAGLEKLVSHRRLIIPQLGATGVSARDVKKGCGFEVVYGPVRAEDIPRFLQNSRKTDGNMRKVTFPFVERLILTPVELNLVIKPALIVAAVLFLISGIGPGFFSFSGAWSRGLTAVFSLGIGIISGVIVTPVLLPFIPFRQFAAKGLIAGTVFAVFPVFAISSNGVVSSEFLSMAIFAATMSSILAMNFTGATPFTSPSGVEKEMRQFLPFQAVGIVLSAGLWIYSAF